jgi:hypothetical protein
MPGNTPLTDTPYALLGDAPNIEAAVLPGMGNLETFTCPRFASVSARNAAFLLAPAPEVGQMIFVTGIGYQSWNGTTWDNWLKVGQQPVTQCRVRSATLEKSTAYVDEQLTVPVEANAVYIIDVFGVIDANIDFVANIGFDCPAGTVLTYGVLAGHGTSDKTNTFLEAKSVVNTLTFPADDLPVAARDGSGSSDWDGFRLTATAFVQGLAGDIALVWGPQGAGTVRLCIGSWMKVTSVPED